MAAAGSGNVHVVCRFRPQNMREMTGGGFMMAHFDGTGTNVSIEGQRRAAFTFDRVFNPNSTQAEVYNYAAKPIVEDVLKGYNGTIFAYGQTSSGKTHTMEGPDINGEMRGIIPRIVQNVFGYIEIAPETLEFTVRVSYFEIYMERIRDLLCDGNDNLQIHENRERGVYVRHATELFMQDPEEVMSVMASGAERRSVAQTNMNDQSSRSHSVFLMELTQTDTLQGGMKSGKLYLVDLAGSEKVSKTGADGEVLQEAKNINKSLSALGLVIMSLTDGQTRQHVPYRDSKLTRILQESLGGNARTTIIICCSPSSFNEAETFSSLRFGQRAKKIKNNAVCNVRYSVEELEKKLELAKKEMRKLAKRLNQAEAELEVWRSGGSVAEEDRVKLSKTSDEVVPEVQKGRDAASPGLQVNADVMESLKEEFSARESELLDIVDSKVEHVRSLEREIEILGQDKITITKLAAENANQRAMLKDLEERVDEMTAENTEYEVAIEDMARANNTLDEELARNAEKLERLEKDHSTQATKFNAQTQLIAEMVASLASETPVDVALETGTIVDGQFVKARHAMQQVREDLAALQTKYSGSQTAKEELEGQLEDQAQAYSALKVMSSQTEEKLGSAVERSTQLETQIKDVQARNASLMDEKADIMGKLEMSEAMKQQASSEGAAKVTEMKDALDRQKQLLDEQHAEKINDLRAELETTTQHRKEQLAEKERLQIELNDTQGSLEKLKSANKKLEDKLQGFENKSEKEKAVERKAHTIVEATKQQLEVYHGVKEKMRSQLLARCSNAIAAFNKAKAAAESGGSGGDGNAEDDEKSKHIGYLKKTNRELNQQKQESAKALAALQREKAVLEKQLVSRSERIKNLELLMKDGEDRLAKQYQRHLQEIERLKHSSPQQRVVRRKASVTVERPRTVVRGSSGSKSTDGAKADFWKNQQSRSGSTVSAGGVNKKRSAEMLAVEFV